MSGGIRTQTLVVLNHYAILLLKGAEDQTPTRMEGPDYTQSGITVQQSESALCGGSEPHR